MAEFIHYKAQAEKRELEEMLRIKLFTDDEIREIKINREKFRHKLEMKESYLNFIKYEEDLLKLCRHRRNKYRINDKKEYIEISIVKRIKSLHNEVSNKYPLDIKLKVENFKFCTNIKDIKAAANVITNLTKCHPEDVKVWHLAAEFQQKQMKDIDRALNVLLKSLHYHKSNPELFQKCFEFELIAAENQKNASNSDIAKNETSIVSEEKCNELTAKAKIVLESAKKTINDVNFYIKLIEIAKSFDFTSTLQKLIGEHLCTNYSNMEITWHQLAEIEMSNDEHKTPKQRINDCISKYMEGISKLPTVKMWSYFIDKLLELYMDKSTLLDFKTTELLNAFEEANKQKLLDGKYYIKWAEMLPHNALDIFKQGCENSNYTVDVWTARLRYHIMEDVDGTQENKIGEIFEQAVENLKHQGLSVWNMYMQYHMIINKNDLIEKLFARAVEQPGEISKNFKIQYINWLVMTYGREKTRKIYNEIADKKPYCLELHKAMALIESIKIKQDIKEWEIVLKNACDQFGNSADVWVEYIKFDRNYKSGINANQIRLEALKHLDDAQKMILENELCNFNIG